MPPLRWIQRITAVLIGIIIGMLVTNYIYRNDYDMYVKMIKDLHDESTTLIDTTAEYVENEVILAQLTVVQQCMSNGYSIIPELNAEGGAYVLICENADVKKLSTEEYKEVKARLEKAKK